MKQQKSSELELQVARVLRDAGVQFITHPAIGGVQPDFLVQAADGHSYVLEVKGWASDRQHIERAVSQARLFQTATGADGAYVVLADITEGDPKRGFLALHEVAHWAAGEWSVADGPRRMKSHTKRVKVNRQRRRQTVGGKGTVSDRIVFAAMPFSREYDDVFFVPMAHAAELVRATCRRVDKEDFEGDIVEEIKRLIRASVAVIADLSDARPNVLYELGYAHALRKPTVPICCSPLNDLPFDVRNWNVLEYARGRTHQLREALARRLKAAISKGSA
jgi:hypothetical protein